MIGADGCCADEFQLAALKQRAIAAGAGAGKQHISITHHVASNLIARHIKHFLSHLFKNTFEIRDFAVGNNLHLNTKL